MKALAWWHATPKNARPDARRESRLAARLRDDPAFVAPLPEVASEFAYLLAALFEAGPMSADGMGHYALKWVDLHAWAQTTGTELMPWEARLIKRLSSDYVMELHLSEDPARMCSYLPEDYEPDLRATASSLRSAIANLANL